MKLELVPMKKLIDINSLQEVSDSILFEKGYIPTSKGVLSTQIFGVSVNERRKNYAFIDLKGYFIHPYIYKILKRLNRKFETIVQGQSNFKIENGDLIEIGEEETGGGTGLDWLYKNWDKIKFKRNDSSIRNERIDVLENHSKDILFCHQWIVIPAFYRDVNLQNASSGKISHNELNDLYMKLIRLASVLSNSNTFDFVLNNTKAKIQNCLIDIYDSFKGKIEKKNGLIRKSLLGKSVDYGVRSVITAPVFDSDTVEDMKVDFYHTGVPLYQCCSLFTPFIIHWVRRFFIRECEKIGSKYPVKLESGEIIYVKLEDPDLYFNVEYIKKKIDRFVASPADRFEKIELPINDPRVKKKVYMAFSGREYEKGKPETESPLIHRPATWTDILYMAATDVTEDKHIIVTRYPLLDYFGTFPNRITVLSTHRTYPVYVGGKLYKHYPVVNLKMKKDEISTAFANTATISNLYLAGLGGDYDGDFDTTWSPYIEIYRKKFCERLTIGVIV